MTDDTRAKNIAKDYSDNILQAIRIGVPPEQVPFVAVCLTVGDILTSSALDMELRSLQCEVDRLRMVYEEE